MPRVEEALVPGEELEHLSGEVYLDYAGAGIYCQSQARAAFEEVAAGRYGNPHSSNERGAQSRKRIEELREAVLAHFGVSAHDYAVVLTSGTTGALRLLAETFAFAEGSEYGAHQHNHNSVLGIRQCCVSRGGEYRCYPDAAFPPEAPRSVATAPSLLAAPLVCNFGGLVVDLSWCAAARDRGWYTLVDAAGAFGKRRIDLSDAASQPDYVVASFYKAVGLPAGLGFLLVRRGSEGVLSRGYFGGGTVEAVSAEATWEVPKEDVSARLEHGTVPFLDVPAALHGLQHLQTLGGARVEQRLSALTAQLVAALRALQHENGRSVCVVYGHDGRAHSCNVAFNVFDAAGRVVGYNTVVSAASVHRISLRGGCFCNPGACHGALGLTLDDVKKHRGAGHVCGDAVDVVDGVPTGAVRASLGLYSMAADVDALAAFLTAQFAQRAEASEGFSASAGLSEGAESEEERGAQAEAASRCAIESLHVFPVKGVCGIAVDGSWPIGSTGLLFDRAWCVVKDHPTAPRVVTKVAVPQLGDLRPIIDVHAAALVLFHRPTQRRVSVPLFPPPHPAPPAEAASLLSSLADSARALFRPAPAEVKTLDVRGRKGAVTACAPAVNAWLNDVLGTQGLLLCRADASSLSNTSDFLVINSASVRELARHVPAAGWNGDASVFRANVVVGGGLAAWEEDRFTGLAVEGLKLAQLAPCERCTTINLNPSPPYAPSPEREPLKTLYRLRNNRGKTYFGVNACVAAAASDPPPLAAAALRAAFLAAAAAAPPLEHLEAGAHLPPQPPLRLPSGPHFSVGASVDVLEAHHSRAERHPAGVS